MTEYAWWNLLDKNPGAFPWYAFADWLGERADPREGAAREVGRRGRRPYLCHNEPHRPPSWDWYPDDDSWGDDAPTHARIGRDVFDAMPGEGQLFVDCREYPTASDAYRALLTVLAGTPQVEPAAAAPGMPPGTPPAGGR